MRIKLDENVSADLVDDLVALGHDVDTATSEGLAGHEDPEVWAGAQAAGRVLITQDLDFSDVRTFVPGAHHGLILVRLRAPSRSRLRARILEVFRSEAVETWERCLVVIGDSKGSRPTLRCRVGRSSRSSHPKTRKRAIGFRGVDLAERNGGHRLFCPPFSRAQAMARARARACNCAREHSQASLKAHERRQGIRGSADDLCGCAADPFIHLAPSGSRVSGSVEAGFKSLLATVRRSIACIYSENQGRGTGTGFVVAKNLIATVKHVMKEIPDPVIELDDGTVCKIDSLVFIDDADLCFVRLSEETSVQPLAIVDLFVRQESILVPGYPRVPYSLEPFLFPLEGVVVDLTRVARGAASL